MIHKKTNLLTQSYLQTNNNHLDKKDVSRYEYSRKK